MWLLSVLGAVAAIVLIILLHEYGHFVVARWCGVRVLRFSIGFGRAVWRRVGRDGVEYRVGILPLGGYVKMLDESALQKGETLPEDAFAKAALWKRFLIVMAGPVVNMLLAIVLFFAVALIGSEQVKPIVGTVTPASIAAQAGVQSGDQLLSVSGISTPTWRSVMLQLSVRAGDKKPVSVRVKRSGEAVLVRLPMRRVSLKKRGESVLSLLGMAPYFPTVLPVVSSVLPDSPAAHADLQPGDRILSFAGESIPDWQTLVAVVRAHRGDSGRLLFQRAGQQHAVTLTLASSHGKKQRGFLGVVAQAPAYPAAYLYHYRLPWWQAPAHALRQTWGLISMNARVLWKLLTRDISTKMLGGPISVFRAAGQATLGGVSVYLRFIAFISVTIGFVNLLPIPGLDGGHVLFQCIELVLRKPVPASVQQAGYAVGLVLLLVIMVQATMNDVLSFYGGS